jgi:hypothetical protein
MRPHRLASRRTSRLIEYRKIFVPPHKKRGQTLGGLASRATELTGVQWQPSSRGSCAEGGSAGRG